MKINENKPVILDDLPEYLFNQENKKGFYKIIPDNFNAELLCLDDLLIVEFKDSDNIPFKIEILGAELISEFKSDYQKIQGFLLSPIDFVEKFVGILNNSKLNNISNFYNDLQAISTISKVFIYTDKKYSKESVKIVDNFFNMLNTVESNVKDDIISLIQDKLADYKVSTIKHSLKNEDFSINKDLISNKEVINFDNYLDSDLSLEEKEALTYFYNDVRSNTVLDLDKDYLNKYVNNKPVNFKKTKKIDVKIPDERNSELLETIENPIYNYISDIGLDKVLENSGINFKNYEKQIIIEYLQSVIDRELDFINLFTPKSIASEGVSSPLESAMLSVSQHKLEELNTYLITNNYIERCVKIQCIGSDNSNCYGYISNKINLDIYKKLLNYFIAKEHNLENLEQHHINAVNIFDGFIFNACKSCFKSISLDYIYDLYVNNKLFTINYFRFNKK